MLKKKINQDILEKFEETKKTTEELIKTYEFGPALHLLYEFFWHDFCDNYLEESKKMESAETSETLLYVLTGTIKLLHPFIPFITEAIWGKINKENKKHLIVESW